MSLRPLRAAVAAWTPGRAIAADPLHALASAWPAIVGDHVAAHSAPLELSTTALVVATRSSAWSQQLQFLSERILTGVRALPGCARVARLTFRVGTIVHARRPVPTLPSWPAATVRGEPGPLAAAAADGPEALARLRARFERLRRTNPAACRRCGAVRLSDGSGVTLCAPCVGRDVAERTLATERLLYLCPWLQADAVREQIPNLAAGEVERIRRRLLQRWWFVLERVRRAKRVSHSNFERGIASSYVLLQSRLPADRITPAVVRNLLGADLERLLWPAAPP